MFESEYELLIGDCVDTLKTLADESVHCVVTSPPYFGLRDYGHDGQIGLEELPEDYIESMVNVFREVKRVLRDDGVVWLNLGDTYEWATNPNRLEAEGLDWDSMEGGVCVTS